MSLFSFLTNVVGMLFNISAPLQWGLNAIYSMVSMVYQSKPFSDVLAGILLLGQVNRKVPKKTVEAPKPTEDWQKDYFARKPEEVQNVDRYVDYAMAIYNWPTYMIFAWLIRPWTLFWTILYLRPFNFFRYATFRREVVGDGIIYKKTAAFMASTPSGTGINNLKYSSFVNGMFQTPFCIVVDDVAKAVVITIRGSTSLDDLLTDGVVTTKKFPKELEDKEIKSFPLIHQSVPGRKGALGLVDIGLRGGIVGVGQHEKLVEVHTGMYLCALNMFGTVETQLISLLSDTVEYEKYKIVVTGHSLGAGVASLLTLMLRKNWGDRVRGYCFSPPGCMIAEEGLEEARKCILSIFVGDDVVPRLSIHSAKDLRNDAIWLTNRDGFEAIKYPVIFKFLTDVAMWPVMGPLSWVFDWPQDLVIGAWKKLLGIDIRINYQIIGPSDVPCNPKMDTDDDMIRLYTPGQILHLTEDDYNSQIAQEWTHRDNLQEIVVGWHMIPDHMPKRVRRIVKRQKHLVSYVPVIGWIPAFRRFVEFWY